MNTVRLGLRTISEIRIPMTISGSCIVRESEEKMDHCTSVTSEVMRESRSPLRFSEKNDRLSARILSWICLRSRCSMPMLMYERNSPAKYRETFLSTKSMNPVKHTQNNTVASV